MKKTIKWLLIVVGGLAALIILLLLIVPLFVNLETFKPKIESKVTEATGRPFKIDGKLHLSLFPSAVVSFDNLHLGNPPGFEKKDFVSVKSFDVKVKLLPLLSKKVEVKRFVVVEPRIVLEKKEGRGNWEGLGKVSKEKPSKKGEEPKEKEGKGLPIRSLAIGELTIKKASVLWLDHTTGESKEISDLDLYLQDVSFDRPIKFELTARLNGSPVSISGEVGPLGKDPGKGSVPLELIIEALKELNIGLKGEIIDPGSPKPGFDLAFNAEPFSPRELFAQLDQDFPVNTSDPKALTRLGLKARIKGTTGDISIREGNMQLDDSNLDFSARARNFDRPDVTFEMDLDSMDLDRYLPPETEEKAQESKEAEKTPGPEGRKKDYSSLRTLVLDGKIKVGELKVHRAKMEDITVSVRGRNGIFNVDPISMKLYQGAMAGKATLDVRKQTPESEVDIHAKGIQAGPMLKDLADKDFIEGTLKADLSVRALGDEVNQIKRSLGGEGEISFSEGAIVGINLTGMVRNVKSAFGMAGEEQGQDKRPRTDFSTLESPFTIKEGVFHTTNTTLVSPVLRAVAKGQADLVKETLDFRIRPKFVATLKGEGDEEKRKGIIVPVVIKGSFSSPKFRPDLEGTVKDELKKTISDPSRIKKLLEDESNGDKDTGEKLEEEGKRLLKGFISED